MPTLVLFIVTPVVLLILLIFSPVMRAAAWPWFVWAFGLLLAALVTAAWLDLARDRLAFLRRATIPAPTDPEPGGRRC